MKITIDISEKDWKFMRSTYKETGLSFIPEAIKNECVKAVYNGKPLPQCKDCKHFETDAFATIDGIPIIVGHEVCTKWGAGCKTKEDGYCFMFESKE